jgi:hypothetical protein
VASGAAVSALDRPANVRAVRRALGLVMVGLSVQLAGAFFWSPATFLLSALIGMPLVVAGVLVGWLARARSVSARPEGT